MRAKLERLERGEWDDSVACPLRGSGSAIPVYEAKPLDNVRILWQAASLNTRARSLSRTLSRKLLRTSQPPES